MAQRLATEYVQTCLHLTEADMAKFLKLFQDHQVAADIKVYENGSQELSFAEADEAGDSVLMSFEQEGGLYVCRGSCRTRNLQLANALRRAISMFKGNAVMHRFYPSYTITYDYEQGAVKRIVEKSGDTVRLIFEKKDTVGELQALYMQRDVEEELEKLKRRVNALLDQRLATPDRYARAAIDERLKELSRKLFALEA